MPTIVWVAVAAVVLPLAVLAQVTLARSGKTLVVARQNLTRGLVTPAFEVGTLEARGTGAGAVLRALTPESAARRIRRMIDVAGRPATFTMTRVLWAKLVLAAGAALLGAVFVVEAPGIPAGLVAVVAVVAAYHLPEAALWGRGQERRQLIARQLPDVLDQMTIAVEAGLGFEAALSRAATTGRGALAEELVRTQHDIAAGRPRRAAYDALAARTQVADLRRFVGAVNQADVYGIPLADVLRVQADEMRVKRRQRAEEQAMKVPVKVTFPLMVCILPALMIVVVGPAVLGLLESLG
ncbi:type II secretion system F family protein [Modestobacter sp. VKM Ac-2979]|uniref:type II secretion system F family protein n=1 Tax=unclassified Modestobacter TaxID=2643866 RepID=UPI0022AB7C53|nr:MULTISPECIES: type II secretion system F family protein [unclassified Modestobacter]MCZ2810078.1 type II secretion system F family protein [Modestobacter sp. VKM Ac-2979]MCZ2844709.1 type II secretion system F family protein [Modestobacter sp. VKM Ac-2980]